MNHSILNISHYVYFSGHRSAHDEFKPGFAIFCVNSSSQAGCEIKVKVNIQNTFILQRVSREGINNDDKDENMKTWKHENITFIHVTWLQYIYNFCIAHILKYMI